MLTQGGLIYQHATRERDRDVAAYMDDIVDTAKPATNAVRELG
jgi:hypothetical protein